MAEVKKAIQRLVRGDDGRTRIILIDLETLQPIEDMTGYRLVSQGELVPEPVADIETPEVPSVEASGETSRREPFVRGSGSDGGNYSQSAPTSSRAASGRPTIARSMIEAIKPGAKTSTAPRPTAPTRTTPTPSITPTAPVGNVQTRQGSVLPELDYDRFSPPTAADIVSSNPGVQAERTGQTTSAERAKNAPGLASVTSAGRNAPASAGRPASTPGEFDKAGTINYSQASAPGRTDWSKGLTPENRAAAEAFAGKQGNINMSSGYRDPTQNAAVGGKPGSAHLAGNAIDTTFSPGMTDEEKAQAVADGLASGYSRVGTYADGSLHFDLAEGYPSNAGVPGAFAMYGGRNINYAAPGTVPGWFEQGLAKVGLPDGTVRSIPTPTARPETQTASLGRNSYETTNSVFDTPRDEGTARGIIDAASAPRSTIERTQIDPSAGKWNDATDFSVEGMTGAKAANMGIVTRSDEEKAAINRTALGELGPRDLEALAAGSPEAMKQYADIVATMENRAASARYAGQPMVGGVLNPTDYNALMTTSLPNGTVPSMVTDYNNNKYGAVGRAALEAYYNGTVTPTSYDLTHYHGTYINPEWSDAMTSAAVLGQHKFGSLMDVEARYQPSQAFREQYAQALGQVDSRRQGLVSDYSGGGFSHSGSLSSSNSRYDSPSEGGSRFGGSGLGSASYSGAGGRDSPSEGGSRFGGSGLGGYSGGSGNSSGSSGAGPGRGSSMGGPGIGSSAGAGPGRGSSPGGPSIGGGGYDSVGTPSNNDSSFGGPR